MTSQLDPQLIPFLEAIGGEVRVDDKTPGRARLEFPVPRRTLKLPGLKAVEDITVSGAGVRLPARIYRAVGGVGPDPVIVFFHGGGWVLGNIDSHDRIAAQLCAESGCTVISVAYRLAPEYKFPIPLEDAYEATCWVAANAADLGVDPDRLAVAGDSAGGNLASSVCVLARDQAGPAIRFQLLVYPITDLTMDYDSFRAFGSGGLLLTTRAMRWFVAHYTEGADAVDWRAAPISVPTVAGLPPTMIVTAELDPLRDQGEAYAERLTAAGVDVVLRRSPGMCHGFLAMPVDEAARTRHHIAAAVRECLDVESAGIGYASTGNE